MTTLAERLKQQTRSLHEETEQLLYADALRQGILTADNYVHLLRTHLAYHQALEEAIDQYPVFFRAYRPESRRKTPWLTADLDHLNELTSALLPDLFVNWSPLALTGAAYVGEGSMLGGKTVWQYLQKSSQVLPLLETARFYRGYGPETGTNWRDFCLFLDQLDEQQANQVVAGAQEAFALYQTLFQRMQATE